jgi:hypothetical protein
VAFIEPGLRHEASMIENVSPRAGWTPHRQSREAFSTVRGSLLKGRAKIIRGTQKSHLTSAQAPGPQPPQPHLPGRPLQGPSPHGLSVRTTESLRTPGTLLSSGSKREIHAKLGRGQVEGGSQARGWGLGLENSRCLEWSLMGRCDTSPDLAGG